MSAQTVNKTKHNKRDSHHNFEEKLKKINKNNNSNLKTEENEEIKTNVNEQNKSIGTIANYNKNNDNNLIKNTVNNQEENSQDAHFKKDSSTLNLDKLGLKDNFKEKLKKVTVKENKHQQDTDIKSIGDSNDRDNKENIITNENSISPLPTEKFINNSDEKDKTIKKNYTHTNDIRGLFLFFTAFFIIIISAQLSVVLKQYQDIKL